MLLPLRLAGKKGIRLPNQHVLVTQVDAARLRALQALRRLCGEDVVRFERASDSPPRPVEVGSLYVVEHLPACVTEEPTRPVHQETKSPTSWPAITPFIPQLRGPNSRGQASTDKAPRYSDHPKPRSRPVAYCSPIACPEACSDTYNVRWNLHQRDGPWRWCEGACRLRGNVSLTPRDISKDWKEGSGELNCRYCNAVCKGEQAQIASMGEGMVHQPDTRKKDQAMRYFAESHAIMADGALVWVCHLCFNRSRCREQAGPWQLDEMWAHWRAHHEQSKCCAC